MKAAPAEFLRGLSDVIFPPSCVHCRAIVETEAHAYRHLCVHCASQLDFVQPPYCLTCGHPFYGVVEGERIEIELLTSTGMAAVPV